MPAANDACWRRMLHMALVPADDVTICNPRAGIHFLGRAHRVSDCFLHLYTIKRTNNSGEYLFAKKYT